MGRIGKISVTVITGFLGAGKTTFINHLLKKYEDTQFALVENEFGVVSIDTKLIKGVDASQMFELKDGCICCSITDEYELVLQELAERFPDVEHLLIETTGVADPASVIRPFFRDENLHEIYSFNGTICLVDAINFDRQIENELKNKQIAVADFVLVNKTEKLSQSERDILEEQIKQINSLSMIQLAEFGIAGQFELENVFFRPKFYPNFSGDIKNHSRISTKIITFLEPLKKEKIAHWLTYTLDVYKNEIYRVKGTLCFENEPFEFILQGVGGSFEIVEGENMVEGKSEIVFIGQLRQISFEVNF